MSHLSGLNYKTLVGTSMYTRMKVFFPSSLWKLLNNVLNKSMLSKRTTTLLKSSFKHHGDLLLEGTPAFFALAWEIEFSTSKKHSTLKDVFDLLKENDHPITIGYNRFKALRASFIPTQEDLLEAVQILRASWSSAIEPGSVVCFDEALWDFRPSKKAKEKAENRKDPIPVVYIPRKPHPNGLLCYFMGTKMFNTNLPYVFDLEPHIQFPQVGPQEALRNSIARWQYAYKAHIVADSAFGSQNLAKDINEWGVVKI